MLLNASCCGVSNSELERLALSLHAWGRHACSAAYDYDVVTAAIGSVVVTV
jgi:hypothetical protein